MINRSRRRGRAVRIDSVPALCEILETCIALTDPATAFSQIDTSIASLVTNTHNEITGAQTDLQNTADIISGNFSSLLGLPISASSSDYQTALTDAINGAPLADDYITDSMSTFTTVTLVLNSSNWNTVNMMPGMYILTQSLGGQSSIIIMGNSVSVNINQSVTVTLPSGGSETRSIYMSGDPTWNYSISTSYERLELNGDKFKFGGSYNSSTMAKTFSADFKEGNTRFDLNLTMNNMEVQMLDTSAHLAGANNFSADIDYHQHMNGDASFGGQITKTVSLDGFADLGVSSAYRKNDAGEAIAVGAKYSDQSGYNLSAIFGRVHDSTGYDRQGITMNCVLPTNDPYTMLNGSVGVELDNNGNTVVTSSLAATLDLLQSTSNFIKLSLTTEAKSELGESFGNQMFIISEHLQF